MGGKREFQWVDGTALGYEKYLDRKPWSDIEPNENIYQKRCVHNKAGGLWADYLCEAKYNYICGPAGQEWCQFISKYECQDEFVYTKCIETCSKATTVTTTTTSTTTPITVTTATKTTSTSTITAMTTTVTTSSTT